MKLWTKMFGDTSSRFIKSIQHLVTRVNEFEPATQKLSDADFPLKTESFKERLSNGESLDDILPEAFALVREASVRTLKQRHYDVQIMGGIVLHSGKIAEMRTGEGKTLVATLPVYLNALTGHGVHIVTVNDYLARRDVQWMGQIYSFLGLTSAVINDQNTSYIYDTGHQNIDAERDELGSFKVFHEFLRPCTRKEAYDADITYGTNSQFGFDYLRDNTQRNRDALVQREHAYVIVDEIDSILIDEARVPLILSTMSADAEDLYRTFATVASQMNEIYDYTIDEKYHAVQITDSGINKAEQALGIKNLYTAENIKLVHHLETAVRAKALNIRDRDYVVKDGQVVIVDPFTGRMQDGRRWSDGIHQAVEAKEGLQIKQETRTMASITYQNYFKFYDKLSGMTGTAITSEEEFRKVYGLDVIEIPTNRPMVRIDNVDFIYQNEDGKFKAIAHKVKELQGKGQPVLVGTVSVEKNELLSKYFTSEGVRHTVLNAKNHESEGEIIAQAGKKGSVTVATNMAGRGVDIKLGGIPYSVETEVEVKKLGGLCVIGTERHEARRIDNQLRGRSGRQGDPGETQFYVSLDDPLMRVFGSDRMKNIVQSLGMPEDVPIQNSFISGQLEKAQEKIEGLNFDARKHILEYDDVLSYHRTLIYKRRRKILFGDMEYLTSIYDNLIQDDHEASKIIPERRAVLGEEKFWIIFKEISLQSLDRLWMEHLEVMDQTRQSVNLRAYGQREPIVEYKRESLRLFQELERTFILEITHIIKHIDVDAILNPEKYEQITIATPVSQQEDSDTVVITKGVETKEVKRKKLNPWIEAGWTVRE
ncbi:preprotein translocase subunit SecA [Candidatus Nomurabacteria bacterium RIFCSPLOWO2_01_FULL_36_10b]|uniref:Protein translocase subunit SecA n=1 Tax=Candidatus Nomurabacteria bacterium RIFCSPLOWO2_01_FULL_36_10b TaxID=1801766 RepID=A0A1F6WMY0_9BACT|nr:MAG: preprotein translocase subunit SecA [Candidatus Nomurabacteria bacterium RIFCSPLOWO2_01_FULL_36_10b]